MKKTTEAPPIWVWGIAVLLGIGVCFWQSIKGKQLKEQEVGKTIGEYLSALPKTNSEIKILIIGSSMVTTAFPQAEKLSKIISEKAEKSIEITLLAIPNARVESLFGDKYVYEELAKFQPDYIFIDKATLLVDTKERDRQNVAQEIDNSSVNENKFNFFEQSKAVLRNYHPSKNKFSVDNWLDGRIMPKPTTINEKINNKQEWGGALDTLATNKRRRKPRRIRSVKSVPFSEQIEAGITYLQNQQIKIITLDIPYAEFVEKELQEPQNAQLMKNATNYLSKDFGITIWELETQYPYNHYRDFVHMHKLGKEKYTKWFAEKLSNYLKH